MLNESSDLRMSVQVLGLVTLVGKRWLRASVYMVIGETTKVAVMSVMGGVMSAGGVVKVSASG